MPNDDNSSISAQEAKRLFADWRGAPAVVLAVSGGPDSIALMWLAARWRRALARGPRLVAVTVDHGFRAGAPAPGRGGKRPAPDPHIPPRKRRRARAQPRNRMPG